MLSDSRETLNTTLKICNSKYDKNKSEQDFAWYFIRVYAQIMFPFTIHWLMQHITQKELVQRFEKYVILNLRNGFGMTYQRNILWNKLMDHEGLDTTINQLVLVLASRRDNITLLQLVEKGLKCVCGPVVVLGALEVKAYSILDCLLNTWRI